jgi:hypothetical protein
MQKPVLLFFRTGMLALLALSHAVRSDYRKVKVTHSRHHRTDSRAYAAANNTAMQRRQSHPRAIFARDPSQSEYALALSASGDSIGRRIVEIALANLGYGPDSVGIEHKRYPFSLGRYLGPREAWCSEFVSWARMVANIPFRTSGRHGWIIRSSRGIKDWYMRRQRFIDRQDPYWNEYSPNAGDYIRYNNDKGGHSGIVIGVSGSALYTVEGNVKNRVVKRKIKNWRNRSDIDGIGLTVISRPRRISSSGH